MSIWKANIKAKMLIIWIWLKNALKAEMCSKTGTKLDLPSLICPKTKLDLPSLMCSKTGTKLARLYK